MAVLHFFLVNPTLIYILFSLATNQEMIVETKQRENLINKRTITGS